MIVSLRPAPIGERHVNSKDKDFKLGRWLHFLSIDVVS